MVKQIDVAWVGSRTDFNKIRGTRNGMYFDAENQRMYYCISSQRDMAGRRFDEFFLADSRYSELYYECLNTRYK